MRAALGQDIRSRGSVDYDEEGRRVLAGHGRLSLRGRLNDLDIVTEHPGGGKVYVGNYVAAQSKAILGEHKISHIVNCLDVTAENFHEKDTQFTYFRFPIASWWREDALKRPGPHTHDAVIAYFDRLFKWGDPILASGKNILIHCLAGAHRAGTTGVAYVMHLESLPFQAASRLASSRRSQINPIGTLLELGQKFGKAVAEKGQDKGQALDEPLSDTELNRRVAELTLLKERGPPVGPTPARPVARQSGASDTAPRRAPACP